MQIAAPIVGALIGATATLAGIFLTDGLRRRRSMSDRKQLEAWVGFFDRPAWQGPFTAKSDKTDYVQVLEDTIRAINTGALYTRRGKELVHHQVRGKQYLRDKKLRAQMNDVVNGLGRIRALVGRQNDSNYASEIMPKIDHERDRIIEILNDAALRFRVRTLPIPTKLTYDNIWKLGITDEQWQAIKEGSAQSETGSSE